MKLRCIIPLSLLNFFISINGFTQNIFKNTELSFGYSVQPQDRRLFDFPLKPYIIQTEESRFDYQYDLIINKSVFNTNKLNISAGIGYSLFQSKFSRPYDQYYLNGSLTKELRLIHTYFIHNLVLESALKFDLIKFKKSTIRLGIPIDLSFAFNKSIKSGNSNENNWIFEFNKLEIYSGIRYQTGKFNFGISFRLFNIQVIDHVVFNEMLFHLPFPSSKKTERYNLSKFMFNIGYKF